MSAQMAHSIGRLTAACILVVSATTTSPASGADSDGSPSSAGTALASRVILLPSGLVIKPGVSPAEMDSAPSQRVLLQAIVAWLSSELGLPAIQELPAIGFASQRRMVSLRYRDMSSDRLSSGSGAQASGDIVAIYDDEAKIIYLPEGWSGKTPSELSVLVHEMVHHIQNLAGLKFECAAAKEEMAFEAQDRWLHMFGRDLLKDFGLDPFTVFVRSKCIL
ncbi:hypothetical protein ILFOPFJJ_06592 [Ensifer psoraleae]|uniref:DUF6647 family protein n=1 Tax=Sinorhizobium psoraleae TaxID=520838 RepID=UPI00156954E4|nr:DUF6647 family protein [Sinorhizobium psoraleae]NRP75669.1 hypothetical protein [Sinorhizobium psoraleae]